MFGGAEAVLCWHYVGVGEGEARLCTGASRSGYPKRKPAGQRLECEVCHL